MELVAMLTDSRPSSQVQQNNYQPVVGGIHPPQAIDLEESVLGALLLEKDALTDIVDILKSTDFYKEAHQHIYQSILTLFRSSDPIDIHTLSSQLRKEGNLDKVGGIDYLVTLSEQVASAAHLDAHVLIIKECATRRSLISVATQLQKGAYDYTQNVLSLLDKSEESFFQIYEKNTQKNYRHISSLMNETLKEIEIKKTKEGIVTGIPTGFKALDQYTSGLQKGDLIGVAAVTSMGKTSFMTSLLCNAAVQYGHAGAFFSLEIPAVQITNRLISAESGLENQKIRQGQLKDYEWQQLYDKTSELSQAPIYVDDTPALSLFEFRAKCRRLKARHHIEFVCVDYLQLMSTNAEDNRVNREQELGNIVRGVKAVAKELEIPIILASQLSRGVEARGGDMRPRLWDLRGSGQIEHNLDIALFLYRPEYYGITQDEKGNSNTGITEVIVAKNRNGPLGSFSVRYLPSRTKFADFDAGDFNDLDDLPFGGFTAESKANWPDS